MNDSTITADHAVDRLRAGELEEMLREQVRKTATYRVRVLQLEAEITRRTIPANTTVLGSFTYVVA